ncbi:hypothetical protein MICRO80W_170044 [Micrococcus luteus]|nr:hypothetical protein MICRO116_260001 [Micrococcus sp. 116]VWX48887.1 hypothetical protein MICRO80W_170044 [Micrococcus luteus]VXB19899.1 hypothetical protein MICRO11B_200034 [Micrococcus luteus]
MSGRLRTSLPFPARGPYSERRHSK